MKKIKLYLDTNTIIDFFILQAKAMKKGIKPKVPKKFKFFIKNLDKMEFYTSIITKAEVVRELVSGFDVSDKHADELWNKFMEILECKFIENVTIDKRFSEIVSRMKMKLRTLMNFQHLFIAMDNELYLFSGDKNLIEIVRKNKIYDKILSYPELRKLISSFSSPNL